ncbi:hypothetical protein [Halorussus salinisoli]|uniref:hypothetical protein n=1 Tax=Halorussus salinisoli TaxID=2558242 RepID=UPI0010C21EA6|nr:hypothetical protein [Halorussus salinisoli]
MSGSNSTGWSAETPDTRLDSLRRVGVFLLTGVAVGTLAGMGTFVYNATQFLSVETDVRLLLVPVVAAGSFAHLFASSLQRSIRLGLIGFFVGLFVFVGAWIAPLWILPYPPEARGVLLPKLVGDTMSAAFINYATAYLGGYLATVTVAAFWE